MKKTSAKLRLKQIRLLIEALLTYITYYIFKLVPINLCTKIGYFLGYYILANIPIQRKFKVANNIAQTFPEYNQNEVNQLYKKSCANFCSLLLELPHTRRIAKLNKIHIIDKANVLATIKNSNSLFFSAHIGNWELLGYPYFDNQILAKTYVVYKAPGNYYLAKFFTTIRVLNANYQLITLNKNTMIQLYKNFKKEPTSLMMLVDQRIKEGILVNFLYKPAYTSQILPMLAIKTNAPLIPIRSIRNSDKSFSIEISPPIILNKLETLLPESEQIKLLTEKMNATIGKWIKEFPEQWFWLHHRW